jgi:hypothetical protein
MMALAALLVLASFLHATSAHAALATVEGHPYGVQGTSESIAFGNVNTPHALNLTSPQTFNNTAGNPVVHGNNVYAIYWDPTGDRYHGDWRILIDRYLKDVATASGSLGNVFAIDSQYTDSTNSGASYRSTFRGAYSDTNPYPAVAGCNDAGNGGYVTVTCLSDEQIQSELQNFVAQHNLPKGMNSIFLLLTPPEVEVCLDAGSSASHCSENTGSTGLCSYHSAITPTSPTTGDGNTILYAMVPWTAGGLEDGHLPTADQGYGSLCQDGNWDAADPYFDNSQEGVLPNADVPTEQEPNQVTAHPGPDGYYDTGLADLIINDVAIDLQNTITDPLLNAWHDNSGFEVGDECRNDFLLVGGGTEAPQEHTHTGTLYNQTIGEDNYYVNDDFNLAGLLLNYPGVPCVHGVNLVPQFTAPSTVKSGDIVGFDGSESDVTLDAGVGFTGTTPHAAYPTYTWDFGDGSPEVSGFAPGTPTANSPAVSPCPVPWAAPCAASTYHSYQYGGEYEVTLTVTDVGGNTAKVTNTITVEGPPPPTLVPTPGGSGAPGTGTGSGSSGSGSTNGVVTLPGPVAHAAAASRSLTVALRKGLQIRYSVNEQVAGHFEVLLPTRMARRLGIQGSAAQGLPAGTAPSLVIAHAILVTTKGGHSSVRIKFSKKTAARLHRLKTVSLTLRLIVHNAATVNPQSTTVMTTIVLHK